MEKDLQKITNAWQAYISQGRIKQGLNQEIKRSWQRCAEYKIDPLQDSSTHILQENNLREKLDKYEEVIRIATPIMKELYKAIKGSNFMVLLTDEQGYILKSIGDDSFMSSAQAVYLIEGASWHERIKGTNAIGTVIEEQSPLNIYASEHFSQENHFLTCSAAPIFDADDNFIGVLDVSGNYQSAHQHTLGMVVAATNAIRQQLLLRNMQQELMISEKKQRLILNSSSEGFFTINKNGVITQINQKGSKLLGHAPQECIGKELETFFPDSTFSSLMELTTEGQYKEEIVWNLKREKLQVTSKAQRVFNEDEEVTGLVVKVNDFNAQDKSMTKEIEKRANYSFSNIIGESKAITDAIKMAQKVAISDSTILLTGESGTGKELFAQAIHNQSFRQEGQFVAVNCGAIPKDLIESELFGYQEGAFTGAKKGGKPGKFEIADGGTIFLDEIGEMDLNAQVKLLRVLQEKTVGRIGSNELIPINVRIIAATNKDLKARVEVDKFRKDLYYRLNVININLPPLRERENDVIILAKHLLQKLGKVLGKPNLDLSEQVKVIFRNYNWPGNIRELENIIERALNLTEGTVIKKEHLPDYLKKQEVVAKLANGSKLLSIEEAEAKAIREALEHFEGNISQTARCLKISRNTLYRKLNKYDIDIEN
ncbi:MAG: GAF modulated Fis family sigma-54 specific transcriptional regulator [Candidatus Frackibacter sp. T328-2]|nr:MAG: GAF modulated Fis family sigma-54 specific transcriptional regulator [Candidatus Frackibacter sp. T328-2]